MERDHSERTYPLTSEWLLDADIKTLDKCPRCEIPETKDGIKRGSTQNDVILSTALGFVRNIIPFVRSARTVGCKATIVVFASKGYPTNNAEYYNEFFRNCNVKIIHIGREPSNREGVFYLRYLLYHSFLKANRGKVDRVIFCDLFDSIIQKDPFTSEFNRNEVILFDEGNLLKQCGWNTDAIRRGMNFFYNLYPCFKADTLLYDKIVDHATLNGGTQFGGAEEMIKFTDAMMDIGDPFTLTAYGDDQGLLNIFTYSGVFKGKFNYRVEPSGSSLGTNTALYFLFGDAKRANANLSIGLFSRGNKYPGLVHQYDRSNEFVDSILTACTPPFYDTSYINSIDFHYKRYLNKTNNARKELFTPDN